MNKPILDKKESECYMRIVKSGNMDEMFNLGYAIGRESSIPNIEPRIIYG